MKVKVLQDRKHTRDTQKFSDDAVFLLFFFLIFQAVAIKRLWSVCGITPYVTLKFSLDRFIILYFYSFISHRLIPPHSPLLMLNFVNPVN